MFVGSVLLAGSAYAGEGGSAVEAKTARHGACQADIDALCGSAGGDGRGRWQCVREQEKAGKLSPQCSAQLQGARERHRATVEACSNDKKAFCDSAGGGREVGRCMHQHRDQLSAPCREALAKRETREYRKGGESPNK
jgi:hypothetical protein